MKSFEEKSLVNGRAADIRAGLLDVARGVGEPSEVRGRVRDYQAFYDGSADQRRRDYAEIVNTYYDLVTSFFEYGWGQSFHFAPRARGETLRESIVRHEYWLALQLALDQQQSVLDVGCGVGGPMRAIARFTGSRITGINNNAYQVKRSEQLNREARLDTSCIVTKGDFMAMSFPDASFDAVYAIEATVHAPNLAGVYAEIRRVLKPGGLFATYEWCLTPRFVAADPGHRKLKRDIEIGNGIANLSTSEEAVAAIDIAGLELLHVEDRCIGGDIPWWEPLAPAKSPFSLRRTSGIGRSITNVCVRALETLKVAPQGTTKVARLLETCGRTLVASGEQGIFTPGLFILARKGRH